MELGTAEVPLGIEGELARSELVVDLRESGLKVAAKADCSAIPGAEELTTSCCLEPGTGTCQQSEATMSLEAS